MKIFSFYSKIPLPILVVGYLIVGLLLGYMFPKVEAIKMLNLSGTYFPKTIVTFAALLIFNLLASAMCKLMLYHKEAAGKLFSLIFCIYLIMGCVSLIYVTGWILVLTDTPISLPGVEVPGVGAWLAQIGHTFANVMTQQPLLQALIGAMVLGWVSAKFRLASETS